MSEKVAVTIPGVGVVHFPAHMTDAEIAKARDQMIYESQGHGTVGKIVGGATEFLGKSALPAVGSAVGSIFGPPGTIVGGMGGEMANQALGITDPSMQDVVTSGAFSAGGLGAMRGAGALLRRAPGVPPALHEMAAGQLEQMPGRFAPTRPSADLYAVVEKMAPKIRADKLRAAAEKLASTEEGLTPGLANDEIRRVARGVVDFIDQHAGEVPFQTLRAQLRRIGDRTGSMGGSTPDEVRGAYKHLFRTGHDDLEIAAAKGNPAMPAVQALKEANAAAKVEYAVNDLTELFSVKGGGLSPRPDGQFAVNFGTILKKLEKDPSFRKALGEDSYKELVKDLNSMWKVTPNLPSLQPDAGSKATLTRQGLLGGAGGALGGYLTGNTTGAAIGAGTAVAGGIILSKTLASLAATKAGRAVIKGMIEYNKGLVNTDALAALAPAVGMTDMGREASHGAVGAAQGVVGGLTQ